MSGPAYKGFGFSIAFGAPGGWWARRHDTYTHVGMGRVSFTIWRVDVEAVICDLINGCKP